MQIVDFPMGRLNYFALDVKKVMVFNADQFANIHTMFGWALVIISGKKVNFVQTLLGVLMTHLIVYY